MLSKVEEGKVYTNSKTGARYTVLHIATASWDIEQVLVVYTLAFTEFDIAPVWVRSLMEFKEKFE